MILALSAIVLLCWGRILMLKGIWWDDWAWVWHYFVSGNITAFTAPFLSLRHIMDGYILFFNFKLFGIFSMEATQIWNVFKFIIYSANAFLLYVILRQLLSRDSVLPMMISLIYLTSPLVNNLCLVEFVRRIYLFLFLLSLLLSIKSVNEKFNVYYYFAAVLCGAASMFGLESFVFFDVARPVLLLAILRKNWKVTLLHWLPFIAIGCLILLNNTGLLSPRSGVYAGEYQLYGIGPLKYLATIAHYYARSIFYLFAGDIYHLIKEAGHCKADIFIPVAASISAVLAVFVFLFKGDKDIKREEGLLESGRLAIAGIFFTAVGLFPYIMVRGYPAFGVDSRHALLGAIGASITIASILAFAYYKAFMSKAFFYGLVGCVIFLNAYQCNSAVKAYSDDWRQQTAFWQKFTARVPSLKDNTYFVVDMPRYREDYFGQWRGSYEFAAPLNLLYSKDAAGSMDRYYAESVDNALDRTIEWSYINNRNKLVVEYLSYKGMQRYYPGKLLLASYQNNELFLHDRNGSVLNTKEAYPLRWLIK